ncbi:MAG TPA: DUF434 domain-containing protein [Rectinemataceae bacterium]|nr:DUF434 domain-containing protein [Rectinemataceae bacterium]
MSTDLPDPSRDHGASAPGSGTGGGPVGDAPGSAADGGGAGRGLEPSLAEAARDYRFLLDRGYPERSSGELVGNRRRLEAEGRQMLFRGVASSADSARRRSRLASPAAGALILLDVYNVAFTLVHYFLGKACFLCSDGLVRDAGANYGRVPREELLHRAFGEIASYLGPRGLRVEAFLDAPVSRSGEHAAALRAAFAAAHLESLVELAASADGAIAARLGALAETPAAAHGPVRVLVASSDSVLVDRAPAAWDLGRELLESRHAAFFPDFGALLDAGK